MDKILEKWDEILQTVKTEHDVSDISFDTWIKPLEVFGVEGNTLYILVPSEQMTLSYISKKYYLPLKVAIAEIIGTEYEIQFILPEQTRNIRPSNNKGKKTPEPEASKRSNLNPNYTFDTFVVGSNNRFAQSASLAVAESPGEAYNPLYIYGGPGLGKTHLMHSIGHFILERNPEAKVLYVTSEEFTNEVIESIRSGNASAMNKFREKYRTIDVLMIDDVQFIIGKESTQEEFFHTFNALHSAGKQIILTSDKPPKDMEILEDRLRSRFQAGYIATMENPDLETRIAIFRSLLEREYKKNRIIRIDNDSINYVALQFSENVRVLQGAFTKLIGTASIDQRLESIDLEYTKHALAGLVHTEEVNMVNIESIQNFVSSYFNIKKQDLLGKKRKAQFAFPRQIAMYLCRDMINESYPQIAAAFSRDHTTILHAYDKITKEIEKNEETKRMVAEIKQKLTTCG